MYSAGAPTSSEHLVQWKESMHDLGLSLLTLRSEGVVGACGQHGGERM